MSTNTIEIRKFPANLTRVCIGNVVVWFHDETPVAFHVMGQRLVVTEAIAARQAKVIPGAHSVPHLDHREFVNRYGQMQFAVARAADAAASPEFEPATPTSVKCDMTTECDLPAAFLGAKGYVYCTNHREHRRGWEATRPLRKWEIQRILDGKPLVGWNATKADAERADREQA